MVRKLTSGAALSMAVAFLLIAPFAVQAQNQSCGVVDAIDYPIPVENLVKGYDDFGLFRKAFGGNHTGIDGCPVRACRAAGHGCQVHAFIRRAGGGRGDECRNKKCGSQKSGVHGVFLKGSCWRSVEH